MGDLGYEKQFIGGLLQDETLIRKAHRAKISPMHITDENCRYIYNHILRLAEENSEINANTVTHLIKFDNTIDSKDKSVYVKMVEELAKKDLTSVKFSVNFLIEKRKNLETKWLLQNAAEKFIEKGQAQDIINYMKPELDRIDRDVQADVTEYTDETSWKKRKAERTRIVSDSEYGLKFCRNLSFMNRYFKRGLESATITSIGGNTGVGKSIMLNNITFNGIHPKNKLNGLYIIAENKKIQTESRLDSILLDKTYNDLFPEDEIFKDEEADKLFEQLHEDGWGRLFTVKFTVGQFDANDIDAIIEDLEDDGVEINFLVIDSPDHMAPTKWLPKTNERKGQVYLDIKALVDKYNFPAITSLPMTSSAAKATKVQAEDSAGSYDIARICDNQIFFYKNSNDELLGRRQIEVVKNRDGMIDGKKISLKLRSTLRFELWDDELVGEESNDYVEHKIKRRIEHKSDVMSKFKEGGSSDVDQTEEE